MYIKVHCKYDDWDVSLDQDNQIISLKKGEFTNLLKDMVRIYKRSSEAALIYNYDAVGNRTRRIINGATTEYSYYPGTKRLISDQSYGYRYDVAGNLIKKGNRYSIRNKD